MEEFILDFATINNVYSFTIYRQAQQLSLWRNDPLLYKIRAFIYGSANKEDGLKLSSHELADIVRWMYEVQHVGEQEKFCYNKLRLILYLHCRKEIAALEQDIATLEKIKQSP